MQATTTLGPEWLAHRFDESAELIRFVDYDRETRSSVPFLIDQYLPARPFVAMSRDEAKLAAPPSGPLHFIFHSGFCCSTLLAACFDQPGLASSLSEPMILNDIFGWRKRGASPADAGSLLVEVLDLLARPFEGDGAAIVKPSTLVNGLARAMLRLRPNSRAVFIHAPLRDFLISIAKKGLDGRLWVRELFMAMRLEGLTKPLGFGDDEFFGQTDLQIAACAWLGQQALFAQLAAELPQQIRTVSSDLFLEKPSGTIRAAAELFGIGMTDAQVESALSGPMRRNSKDGGAFDKSAREDEYGQALGAHADEVGKVVQWAEAVAKAAGIPTQLEQPLTRAE